MQEIRRGQCHVHEWPVVVSFTCIHLFTVHVLELGVSKVVGQILENLPLLAPLWNHQTHIETRRNTEPKHAINIHADDLQVHQGGEEFLEAFASSLMKLGRLLRQLLLENVTLLLLFVPLFLVVVEHTSRKATLAKNFDDFVTLLFVRNQATHGVFFVFLVQSCHHKAALRNQSAWETIRLLLVECLFFLRSKNSNSILFVALAPIYCIVRAGDLLDECVPLLTTVFFHSLVFEVNLLGNLSLFSTIVLGVVLVY